MPRLATPDDIDGIARLIERSVHGLQSHHYSDTQRQHALGSVFGIDSQLIIDRTYYTITQGDRYLACGGWSFRSTLFGADAHKTTADRLLDPANEAARIRAFFVDPDHARQGLARLILDTCLAAAVNHGFRQVELAATLPGIPFYQKMGFQPLGLFNQALGNGESLALMKMRMAL
jgi:GNAT superfamily N-acetyltransferase